MVQSQPDLTPLVDLALSLGASEAAVIDSSLIQVSEQLALKCVQPRCENYGLSFSCPPYVEGPAGFRKMAALRPQALVVRLVVPAAMLLSWERLELGRVLHELVATLETEAVRQGYKDSTAFAGGSCKELFCQEYLECQRIAGGSCRHPDLARPSLSGYGVDVFKLIEDCGWNPYFKGEGGNSEESGLAWVAGLILIG